MEEPCVRLSTVTSPAAAGLRDALLVVPLGATEQHGPHLPLSTDTDIAVALADRLAATHADVVVAPSLAYGSSGEHQAFPGTLSIGGEATELVLVELCRSATATWSRVLLLCAHGGNAEPLGRAVARLRDEGRDVRAWTPPWPAGDLHAGDTETSIMLALAPERVDVERLPETAGARGGLDELLEPMRCGGVAAVSPNGVLGDARAASAAKGTMLLERATTALMAHVDAWTTATTTTTTEAAP
jgi:mycofactocin system creatininase family protein